MSEIIDKQTDLNLNIGETFGYGRELIEKELMPFATSVNVSTGAHSGDPYHIDLAIKSCKDFPNMALGALVSYPDIVGYGMRKIQLSQEELKATVVAQIGALAALAKTNKYEIQHVRAHGYLYEQLCTNYSVAETLAQAIQEFSKWIILVGPYSPVLKEASSWTNIRVAFEARVDRAYRADASLVGYSSSDLDIDQVAERARDLLYRSVVKTESGEEVVIKYETIHIPAYAKNSQDIAKIIKGMIPKAMPIKSIDYEPYLSEFI